MAKSDLVDLIYKRTKVNKEDILDVIKALPEALAAAFIESNVPEKTPLNLGPIAIQWRSSAMCGYSLKISPSYPFRQHLNRIKQTSEKPLARTLKQLTKDNSGNIT